MSQSASTEPLVRKVDHIAIAVRELEQAVDLFAHTLGGSFLAGGDNDATGMRLIHLAFPGCKIELMQPLRKDSLLADTMRHRGSGFHHITFMVGDVLHTERALQGQGYVTTGTDVTSPNWSETFLRPKSSFGALVQFACSARRLDVSAAEFGLADVLAGRVVWLDAIPCLRERGGSAGDLS